MAVTLASDAPPPQQLMDSFTAEIVAVGDSQSLTRSSPGSNVEKLATPPTRSKRVASCRRNASQISDGAAASARHYEREGWPNPA